MASLLFTLAFLGIVAGAEMAIHPLEEDNGTPAQQADTAKATAEAKEER